MSYLNYNYYGLNDVQHLTVCVRVIAKDNVIKQSALNTFTQHHPFHWGHATPGFPKNVIRDVWFTLPLGGNKRF